MRRPLLPESPHPPKGGLTSTDPAPVWARVLPAFVSAKRPMRRPRPPGTLCPPIITASAVFCPIFSPYPHHLRDLRPCPTSAPSACFTFITGTTPCSPSAP